MDVAHNTHQLWCLKCVHKRACEHVCECFVFLWYLVQQGIVFSSQQVSLWIWPLVWDLVLWFLSVSVCAAFSIRPSNKLLEHKYPIQPSPQAQLTAQGLAQSRSTGRVKIKEQRWQEPGGCITRLGYRKTRYYLPPSIHNSVFHKSFLFINIFLLYLFLNTFIDIIVSQALLKVIYKY